MDIHVGVGRSLLTNSKAAGREAAQKALEQAGVKAADFLFVFAAPKFEQQAMLDGVRSASEAPMIGGSTAGEISTEGASAGSVVVMAIASKDIGFHPGLGRDIGKGERKAGRAAAQAAKKSLKDLKKAKTVVMTPDGLAGDGTEIIQGVKDVFGEDFEIVGGSLGDEADFKKTYQYFNGKAYLDSVPLVLLSGDFATASGIRAGWESVGNRMRCTKSVGSVVFELDGRPALDVYKEYLGPERAKKLPAIALEFPFGMIDEKATIEGKEYFQLRAPLAVDERTKTITFAANIPEGKYVTITLASRSSVIEGSKLAAEQAMKTLGGAEPRLLMDFDCIGRKLVLGPRVQEEVDIVQDVFGKDVPLIGFFTYGEIGPIDRRVPSLRGVRYHNQTTVLWTLGEPKKGKGKGKR